MRSSCTSSPRRTASWRNQARHSSSAGVQVKRRYPPVAGTRPTAARSAHIESNVGEGRGGQAGDQAAVIRAEPGPGSGTSSAASASGGAAVPRSLFVTTAARAG